MRRFILAALLASSASMVSADPVPKEQLLVPPPNAAHYFVVSTAGKHGDQWMWTLPDGSIASRYSQSLRGWITEVDQVVKLGPDGRPVKIVIRGITPNGDAAETFDIVDGKAVWTSVAESGSAPLSAAVYNTAGGTTLGNIPLYDRLVAAGPAGIDIYPEGHVTLEKGATMTVNGPNGPKTIQLAWMRGFSPSPVTTWLDESGKYFGDSGVIGVLPEGYESNLKAMTDFQAAETAKMVRNIAHEFYSEAGRAPVLFNDVKLFDAVGGKFVEHQSVLLSGGKVAAVGAAGAVTVPAGTRTIDGKGRTLVPGMWDSHLHIGDDWSVMMNMAEGITSFRSPGTDIPRFTNAIARYKKRDLLMGEPFVSQIIDRKNPLAAQSAETVSSEAETVAAVRRIHDAGMWGVKFYTSMNPAWIPAGAKEAHRLGMHVHGHIPATMRPWDAVKAGYDEITHLNFVMMQAMPQDVVDKANTAARFEGPAKFAKDVDLNAEPMKSFIADLAKRKTIVDPTIQIFESQFVMDGGVPAPAYASYMGILSPSYDRLFKAGGYPLIDGYTRDDYKKSYAKMVDLLGALHKAGVTVVAGTDGQGMELVREIEIYRQAGFTPAAALQSATIVPARMVGADKRTGSITIGKEADVVLVDGDVENDLGALRRVVTVVSDGYVMDGDALRKAAGMKGRPK
jgi:cytosine/adenosine deaminase-related metal-dependent hydrolase